MNLIDLIVYLVFALAVTGLIINTIRLQVKLKRVEDALTQASIEKMVLADHMEKLISERDMKSVEETEGFLRFISESRDWAFQYIEDVQNALKEYESKMEEGTDIDELLEAYKKLIEFLPKDDVVK